MPRHHVIYEFEQGVRSPEMPIEMPMRVPTDEERDSFVRDHCRPATVADYQTWLTGYVESGGEITHEYDYPMPLGMWFVLTKSGILPELYGADSLYLIIPAGLRVWGQRTFHGCSGHNTIYIMGGFSIVGTLVPTFTDCDL